MAYFPLWGATFDSDDVYMVGDVVSTAIPAPEEWRQIQKSEVWMARFRNDPHDLSGPQPPVCLMTGARLEPDESVSEGAERFGPQMMESASDAILALRLWQEGWFLDPALAEIIFTSGPFNYRLVGPYRQAFLAGTASTSLPPYRLQAASLAAKWGETAPIPTLWTLIRNYRQQASHASADLAIENFHRSYGYEIPGSQRATYLFTALDAMLGGMSAQRVGSVPLRTPFRQRVLAALDAVQKSGESEAVDAAEEAGWLDEEGRRIRNGLAHGRPSQVAEAAENGYERLRTVVRQLLAQYLAFSLHWAGREAAIRRRLSVRGRCSPAAAYNLALEAYTRDRKPDLLVRVVQ